MGSSNSGRRDGKPCTDQFRSIDVRRLHKDCKLIPGNVFRRTWKRHDTEVASILGRVGNDCVVLSYRQSWRGGPWRDCTNTILLEWTDCHYGGKRPWWVCPGCDRRVALLYSGDGWYSCRHCRQLAYRSQRETQEDLAARRANRVRDKLGWPRGILNMPGGKPKGMHWKTYIRLLGEHNEHSGQALNLLGQSLERLGSKLSTLQ